MLLTRLGDAPTPGLRALEFDEAERFSVDPKTGKCLALSEDARDPVGYFSKRLQSDDALHRADAAFALGVLGDPAALPALKAAAKVEKDPDVRTDMEAAIGRLSSQTRAGD
jgi:HEAT repeat protein